MTAIVLKDFERWPAGILEADIPANNNAQRLDVLNRPAISSTITAQPASPTSGDLYIIPSGKTGAVWSTFATGSIAYFLSGTWYEYTPYEGLEVYSAATNSNWRYDGTWAEVTGGGGSSGPTIYDVTDYGATGDGTTDDTVAIQAAIDAAAAGSSGGGGVVYFPAGTYVVNGALQDTSRSNSQLVLPILHTGTDEQMTIVLRGEFAPPAIPAISAAIPSPTAHSIIKGTLNSGTGSLLGGWGPSGSSGDFTNVFLQVENLTFRMPVNPVLTALDFTHLVGIDLDNVCVDSDEYNMADMTEPTTSTSYGIRCPMLNNGAYTRLGVVNVVGIYKAYEFSEHTVGQQVNAWGCKQAFVFNTAVHASYFDRLMAVHCERVIVAVATHYVDIAQLNIEHAGSGWWVTDYDIDDASNYLKGKLRWHAVLASFGVHDTFTVNGATGMCRSQIGSATEGISGLIRTGADDTITLVLKAPHAGRIVDTTTQSASGTCSATFKINSTALGGSSNSVSSSEQT